MNPNTKIRNFADAKHYDRQNEKRPEPPASTQPAAPPAKAKPQAAKTPR